MKGWIIAQNRNTNNYGFFQIYDKYVNLVSIRIKHFVEHWASIIETHLSNLLV